jgi:streptogramin lyase
VSELGARSVIRVDRNTGAETVVSHGGHFISPSGIAVVADGHLYVSDHGAEAVIDVDPVTGHQKVISSGNHLRAPVDIAVDANAKSWSSI